LNEPKPTSRNPWAWIPSLYFAEGLPNVLVATVSVVFYKNLGLTNAAAAFYTSWLYLPWVLKPLWSPVVDAWRTRREWICRMQLILGAAFAGVALTLPASHFVQYSLALFWLIAFSSATHDIAADGFYILANPERTQAAFSGVRSVAFNIAKIFAQGALVALAGLAKDQCGNFVIAWMLVFTVVAAIFLWLAMYHRWALPKPEGDMPGNADSVKAANFLAVFADYFRKPQIALLLAFLLLYRLGEAQLLKIAQPFLLDPRAVGGLGLSNQALSLVYGTVGLVALICGGLLGGILISRRGLRFWLWPMLVAIHLPDAVFIWLAYAQPQNVCAIGAGVALEQFGYGFGFAAYMLYMIYIARGRHATAHYAICTGFMALGLMLPGMWSGWLQEQLGYRHFFVWVIFATIPSFLVALKIPLDAEFGKKN